MINPIETWVNQAQERDNVDQLGYDNALLSLCALVADRTAARVTSVRIGPVALRPHFSLRDSFGPFLEDDMLGA
ncbi:hypothetical protein ASD02_34710 [Ensifer sp. Root1252]|nr:hypothetical protein ASD02_34710 [Ensifer sp. Root1252]KQW78470.1 hypothetical protein ASD03_25600 [Ensifer sp. Root127]KRC69374.1 hypothetical protein ASE32_34530 [Ensifer sp. Root231]KRC96650.1 hypothetical protein ASE47_30795 [Ensifer sp. Root258]